MSLKPPDKVGRLQKEFCCRVTAKFAFHLYLLCDKICREDILLHFYEHTCGNARAANVDGVAFAHIEASGVEPWLASLRDEHVSKTYRPDPVRRAIIPKAGGRRTPDRPPDDQVWGRSDHRQDRARADLRDGLRRQRLWLSPEPQRGERGQESATTSLLELHRRCRRRSVEIFRLDPAFGPPRIGGPTRHRPTSATSFSAMPRRATGLILGPPRDLSHRSDVARHRHRLGRHQSYARRGGVALRQPLSCGRTGGELHHIAQLFADRATCRSALANQVRFALHTAAYSLMLGVRDAIPNPDDRARAFGLVDADGRRRDQPQNAPLYSGALRVRIEGSGERSGLYLGAGVTPSMLRRHANDSFQLAAYARVAALMIYRLPQYPTPWAKAATIQFIVTNLLDATYAGGIPSIDVAAPRDPCCCRRAPNSSGRVIGPVRSSDRCGGKGRRAIFYYVRLRSKPSPHQRQSAGVCRRAQALHRMTDAASVRRPQGHPWDRKRIELRPHARERLRPSLRATPSVAPDRTPSRLRELTRSTPLAHLSGAPWLLHGVSAVIATRLGACVPSAEATKREGNACRSRKSAL